MILMIFDSPLRRKNLQLLDGKIKGEQENTYLVDMLLFKNTHGPRLSADNHSKCHVSAQARLQVAKEKTELSTGLAATEKEMDS
jgi:hypothetical protein